MTRRTLALTAAAFCVLSPAWADVTATVGMTASQTLDLDTGALGTGTAADLLYTGFNGVLGPLGNGTGRRLALLLSFAEATAGAAAIVITVAYVREILHRGDGVHSPDGRSRAGFHRHRDSNWTVHKAF